MKQLHVEFFSPLEELAHKRTNQAIKNILNILDFANLQNGDKAKLRKIILDEVNGMRADFLEYFDKVSNG
jgi:hypothetical protein